MPIEWKLRELLERHHLSVYALAEKMGGDAGGASKRPGLYAITSSDPARQPTRVSFDLLSEMLTSLCELTDEVIDITDVLEFTPDRDWIDIDAMVARLKAGADAETMVDGDGFTLAEMPASDIDAHISTQTDAHISTQTDAHISTQTDAHISTQTEGRRKRGRPKGSRNKRKPSAT